MRIDRSTHETHSRVACHLAARDGVGALATIIVGDRLRAAVSEGTFIKDATPESVEGVKYDLRMSSRILKGSHTQPIDIDKLPEQERAAMAVEPGEVVFVLTKERLNLPDNIIALLSPKRKMSHVGIMVLGGFCIDPLYSGPLWIGLYNFSSTPFPLKSDRKLIAALFYELSDDEKTDFSVPESAGKGDFPDELIALIKNYKPIEVKAVSDLLNETRKEIEILRQEFLTDRDWKRDFKDSLEQHNNQLGKLIEGLQEEREARNREDDRLRGRLDSVEQRIGGFWTTLTSSFKIAWVIAALIIGVLATYYGPRIIDSLTGGS